jgi:hypothetical protein
MVGVREGRPDAAGLTARRDEVMVQALLQCLEASARCIRIAVQKQRCGMPSGDRWAHLRRLGHRAQALEDSEM